MERNDKTINQLNQVKLKGMVRKEGLVIKINPKKGDICFVPLLIEIIL